MDKGIYMAIEDMNESKKHNFYQIARRHKGGQPVVPTITLAI